MIYSVTARFKDETAADFLRKLTDGTVANQKPDGTEIVSAMNRAVISEDGSVRWSEMCFCPTPLAHERATVLNQHFEDLTTEEIDDYQEYPGSPFMEHLRELAGSA